MLAIISMPIKSLRNEFVITFHFKSLLFKPPVKIDDNTFTCDQQPIESIGRLKLVIRHLKNELSFACNTRVFIGHAIPRNRYMFCNSGSGPINCSRKHIFIILFACYFCRCHLIINGFKLICFGYFVSGLIQFIFSAFKIFYRQKKNSIALSPFYSNAAR